MNNINSLFTWSRIILEKYKEQEEYITQNKLCTLLYLFDNSLELGNFKWRYNLTPDWKHISIYDLPSLSIHSDYPITNWEKLGTGVIVSDRVLEKVLDFVIEKWGWVTYYKLNKIVFEKGTPPNLCQKFKQRNITPDIIEEYFNHKL